MVLISLTQTKLPSGSSMSTVHQLSISKLAFQETSEPTCRGISSPDGPLHRPATLSHPQARTTCSRTHLRRRRFFASVPHCPQPCLLDVTGPETIPKSSNWHESVSFTEVLNESNASRRRAHIVDDAWKTLQDSSSGFFVVMKFCKRPWDP